MGSITPEQRVVLETFLQKNDAFLRSLGPNGKKSKTTPSKCNMTPLSSMWYAPALQVLADVHGDDTYTKAEFTCLLRDLGYAFSNDKGDTKGSAHDYLKPLHGFVDGCMKTSMSATSGVDTTGRNIVRMHLNPRRDDASYSFSLTRMIDKFEQESGNSGHGRMKHSIPFILAAQMIRMRRLLEGGGGENSRKRPREYS